MNTTLNAIKSHDPCREGWEKLLAYLGKTTADDEPLPVLTILESNGLDHALWALRAVEGHEKEMRLFACDCAERTLEIFERQCPGDNRPRNAVEVARRFANGEASDEERSAAWAAAEYAAWAAAWAAAEDAAGAAAWDAAWAAERTWQEARLRKMCGG